MSRVVAYVRLSQTGDTSIDGQIRDIKEYCQQNNLELVKEFNEGQRMSGWNKDRTKFQEMVDFVQDKGNGIVGIVVRSSDRLGRESNERIYWSLHFGRQNIYVHDISRGGVIDPMNPNELLMESVNAYSDDVKKRMEVEASKREMKKRMEKGLPVGKPPYGLRYNKDKTVFVPNEDFDKVKKVLEAKDRNGNMSYTQLVNETGVPRTMVFKIIKKEEMYRTVLEHGYLSEEVRKAFKHMYGEK